MCGRYLIQTGEDLFHMRRIIEEAVSRSVDKTVKTGEIFPTDRVPILHDEENEVHADLIKWGFPHFKNKGVIINARSESVTDKQMFSRSFEQRRCVVPASGFYEWNKSTKQKYLFDLPNEKILYMAALCNRFDGEDRFVILTTDANDSVKDVHGRMPLILTEHTMRDWIYDRKAAEHILHSIPPALTHTAV